MDTALELLWTDDLATIEASRECGVPGYVVLRLRPAGTTLPGLEAAAAARVGAALAAAARAVELATGAERVYLLSFCEVAPQLHFHLFPRTPWLLAAFRAATAAGDGPPAGPALFEWARQSYPPGAALPEGVASVDATAAAIRAALARHRFAP